MHPEVIANIRAAAAVKNGRIVFAEGDDPRVQAAAKTLAKEGLCRPLLLCSKDPQLESEVIYPKSDTRLPELAEALYELNRPKKMTQADALRQAKHPLFFAALLVHTQEAEGAVAGAVFTTAEVLRAGLRVIGMHEEVSVVSSAFLMLINERVLTFADCAVVPDPNPQQLASIALAAAAFHTKLCKEEARVALLSFSTAGSASHPRVNKIRKAAALLREMAPQLRCAGELQADAALVPSIAAAKARGAAIRGDANVLIFPDLDSGNIGYKLVQHLGGARAIGPLILGLKAPFMDMSRACSSEDLELVACIAALLA